MVPYAVWFAGAERTLYHADQLAYWTLASGLADELTSHPWEAVRAVSSSVATADVSLLPAVPVALAMAALGTGRLAYLIAVLVVYGVAVVLALVLALGAVDRTSLRHSPWTIPLAAGISLLLLPALWQPVFIGYLDLGGVAICLVVLALYLRHDGPPISVAELALIGLLVALLALFRRWYTVWSLAFCGVVVAEAALGSWRRRSLGWREALLPLRAPLVVGLAAVATVGILAPSVVATRLGSGYADRFAAYGRSDSMIAHAGSAIAQYGLLALSLALLGAGWLWLRADSRRAGAVLSGQLALTWLLMTRLQHHSPQHWYLYSAGLLMLLGLPAARLLSEPSRPGLRAAAATCALAVAVTVSLGTLWPGAEPAAVALEPWTSARHVRPLVRSDLDEVVRLLHTLDRLQAEQPGWIYVLASSDVLSDQALAFANRSLGAEFAAAGRILQAAHVDLRDGFPAMLLEADWVVVGRPVQTHLAPESQQVVVVPAERFLEGRGIAAAFERVPAGFALEGGVSAEIYRRMRPIAPDELADLSDRLRARYPDRPHIWQP